MRVLVVEDDPSVVGFLEKGLQEAAYAVDVARDGSRGARLACTGDYDVIVLDLMLPGKDGLGVLRDIRERGIHTPVICLTARDDVDDRIKGLDSGADDYLAKPFSFPELLARMRALLRRGRDVVDNPLRMADLAVDIVARSVRRADRRIDLSPNEYALLEYLLRHAGQVVSRTMILDRVWGVRHNPQTNVVDVHINRLRKKVDYGFRPPLIHTIRGVGYVLRKDES